MRILMAIHSLAMGGAERFFTNLAHGLAEKHDVNCYIPALACGDLAMRQRLESLPIHSVGWFTPFAYRMFYKLTLMIQRRFPAFDPETMLHTHRLQELHRLHHFEIVNAHLMPAARQVCTAFEHSRVPITKSDHGDTANADKSDAVMFRRLDSLICPAESNVLRARALPLRRDCLVSKIHYGYRGSASVEPALAPFAGVTFGMVARGVADKGWAEAVDATRIARQRSVDPIRLVLVGSGPCLDELQSKLSARDREWVIFAGKQREPEQWIQSFDVGLLPTCLAEESLPNSIIEYLACGKPVLATSVGGIPEMLQTPEGPAGVLIPQKPDGRADAAALAELMTLLVNTPAHLSIFALRTKTAFSRLSMDTCVSSYESAFAELLAA